MIAKRMVDRMLDLLPPLDVNDPASFVTALIAIFAGYSEEMMAKAACAIPMRSDRPTLRLATAVLDELDEPYRRARERAAAAESAQRLAKLCPPRAQRTPEEQAAVDAQVARVRQKLGIPESRRCG